MERNELPEMVGRGRAWAVEVLGRWRRNIVVVRSCKNYIVENTSHQPFSDKVSL